MGICEAKCKILGRACHGIHGKSLPGITTRWRSREQHNSEYAAVHIVRLKGCSYRMADCSRSPTRRSQPMPARTAVHEPFPSVLQAQPSPQLVDLHRSHHHRHCQCHHGHQKAGAVTSRCPHRRRQTPRDDATTPSRTSFEAGPAVPRRSRTGLTHLHDANEGSD